MTESLRTLLGAVDRAIAARHEDARDLCDALDALEAAAIEHARCERERMVIGMLGDVTMGEAVARANAVAPRRFAITSELAPGAEVRADGTIDYARARIARFAPTPLAVLQEVAREHAAGNDPAPIGRDWDSSEADCGYDDLSSVARHADTDLCVYRCADSRPAYGDPTEADSGEPSPTENE